MLSDKDKKRIESEEVYRKKVRIDLEQRESEKRIDDFIKILVDLYIKNQLDEGYDYAKFYVDDKWTGRYISQKTYSITPFETRDGRLMTIEDIREEQEKEIRGLIQAYGGIENYMEFLTSK